MNIDPDDLLLVREALSQYSDINLKPFPSGEQLLQYLKDCLQAQDLPCLIILDINRPRMDGKQALLLIRSMSSLESVPVVFFSTSSDSRDR